MVHPYLMRREGREKVAYAHPLLRPILEKTLGVPLFQEQIMQIAIAVGGFTPGEADELRRVMSSHWTKPNVMDGLRRRLIAGMLANGIRSDFAEQIYKTIQGFSSYGFPESHAASFALLTYASLYFKARHPDAFVCALLNSQPMGFYEPRTLIADAQRHGVEFRPLDVQASAWDYSLEPGPEPGQGREKFSTKKTGRAREIGVESSAGKDAKLAVRAGFRAIHGLSQKHVDKLVHEREAHGAFQGLDDLIRRCALPRAVLFRLATAGSFDVFGRPLRETLWAIQGIDLDPQTLFFGLDEGKDEPFPPETEWQTMRRAYRSQGHSLHSHPLGVLRPTLTKLRPAFSTAGDLQKKRHQTRVRVAGLLALVQKPPTAKGLCFLSLEDETGLFNAVLTPDVYERCRLLLQSSVILDIVGLLEDRAGSRNVRVEGLRWLKPDVVFAARLPDNGGIQ